MMPWPVVIGEPTISTQWMPAFLALALCEACSQPQAQMPAEPAASPASSASTGGTAQADAVPAIDASGETPTSDDHSSNRQPRTSAR